ncbi:MAG: hypothetical protein ABIJ20_04965 [Nanoarchaeota archaeon]|nr:hypothetical protein [Nanoarchaeota archaeon]MBU1445345.1 hypothetical protein [Nanoarchaeota archaeon]MBU2406887.1 hypothetical protein [Nanoarchaeota archaeon]MBU2420377.1 hypothetical protein [Nanoarchaeota archaeon]MBU2475729.1 hypothetical protein [Nanoarchaeota archaeon]
MADKPVKKFRASNIEAAIWENIKEIGKDKVSFKTVSLSRNWKKQGEDVWRNDVINLRKADIPKALVVLQKAQEELFLNDAGDE